MSSSRNKTSKLGCESPRNSEYSLRGIVSKFLDCVKKTQPEYTLKNETIFCTLVFSDVAVDVVSIAVIHASHEISSILQRKID